MKRVKVKSQSLNYRWFVASLFVVTLCLKVFCTSAFAAETIKIGALLSLSGENASFGITEQRGIEIALEEINASGGINGKRLEVLYGDSKLDAERGRLEYRRLVSEEKVPIILGVTGSGVALTLAKTAEKDQVVLLSDIDTSPALTKEGGRFFFRVIPSDDYSSKVLSKWTLDKKLKKAALIYNSQNDWSMGCKKAIEEAYPGYGGKLIRPIAVTNDTNDFKPALTGLKRENPAAYFVCLMGRQAGLFVRQAADKKIRGPFFGTDPFSQEEFVTNAKDAAESSFFVLPSEGQSPTFKAFQKKFKNKYNQEPDSIAVNAYDSVMLTAAVLRELNNKEAITGDAIRKTLEHFKYEGLAGSISFDGNHDLKGAKFDKFTYKKGKRIPIEK